MRLLAKYHVCVHAHDNCVGVVSASRVRIADRARGMASQSVSISSFSFVSVIRGHHIYKSVWTPFLGEGLTIQREEPRNRHDRFSVCVMKGHDVAGHVPREFSKTVRYFLRSGGQGSCTVSGPRKNGKGLEVPCTYSFEGSRKVIIKLKNLIDTENGVHSCPY